MKKLLCITLALMLALSLPLAAMADGGWVLPYNSIIRYLCDVNEGDTYYPAAERARAWTADEGTRALLVSAAMADVASTGDYFSMCSSALDYGSVYMALSGDMVTIFFFSYNGCLMLAFTPATMQLQPAVGKQYISDPRAMMLDGVLSGAIDQYWQVDKDDVMLQFTYVLFIAEALGWNQ